MGPPPESFAVPAQTFLWRCAPRPGVDPLIGAGGWAYFNVPGADRLAAYAEGFPFVEVNCTFYEWPDPRTVAAWRRRVPSTFRFAIRTHRALTHRQRLRPTQAARTSFARTAKLAERTKAVAIVVEVPATVEPRARDLADVLAATDVPCPVALEARAFAGRTLPQELAAVMEANDVADAVDFSRQRPRTASSTAYGRMFGLGEGNRWEFTDDELAGIRRNGERGDRARVVYAFHGVRMYKDAGRFLTFVRTGKFPPATRQAGLASLGEVLASDATFPASKSELLHDHGWRVIDAAPGVRQHASDWLVALTSRRFATAADVVSSLASRGPPPGHDPTLSRPG